MQAASPERKTKAEVYRLVCDQTGCSFLRPLLPLRGDKGKHSRRNQSVAVSAPARKWIHVIWTLPEGTELLMAGLSAAHHYLVTTSPAATSDSFLSFAALSFPASQPPCSFRRGHQLTNVFLRSHLSLTFIFCSRRSCLPFCVSV